MSTSVDDETILEVLRSNDAPRMTTTEVAGQLPVTRGTTRTRLQRLVDDDRLARRTEGNSVVWWLPERESELDGPETEREADATTDDEADATTDDETDTPEERTASGAGPESDEEEADEAEADAGEEDEGDADEDEADETDETEADETDDGPSEVAVEAVESDGETAATGRTPDAETETRTADEWPEPSSDEEEGVRVAALVAAALVVLLLLRRLLAGGRERAEE